MAQKITPTDFDPIILAVTNFSEGATFDDIFNALKIPISKRTLHRRIAALIDNGTIEITGKSRPVIYRLRTQIQRLTSNTVQESSIPLSPAASIILKKISKPPHMRPHVSYNREFLDAYIPNRTFYLPENVRQHLFDLGKPSSDDRPAGTYARQIYNRLLIDLSWNSSRLEGNTYSLLETERLLAFGEATEGKDRKEAQMILNHKAAIEFIVESIDDIGINRYTILNLHALLSSDLLPDPRSSGRLRIISVGIGKSVYHPLEVPQLIEECFNQILDTAKAISDPLEQAFFLMVHLPYLQPFEVVNKRVSRLAANMPLIKVNLCPLSFVEVPEVTYINGLLAIYELNQIELFRDVFIWAYERSSTLYSATKRALGEPDPFRLRYRPLIVESTREVVLGHKNKKEALEFIKKMANATQTPEDQVRFIEVLEMELMNLHEGNIARYRLRPSEYETWRKIWS